jgi:hypothetical protein
METGSTKPDVNSHPIDLDETSITTLPNSSNKAGTVIEKTKEVLSNDEMQFT